MEALYTSPYFGVALSVIAFGAGVRIQQKTKSALCNPLIIAIVLIIGVLLVFKIPYDSYNNGGEIINMFLAPATACLAVSIYTKLSILKKYWLPIIVGCIAGSLASMASVYGMCRLFRLDQSLTMSMLPKSVTTPIAVSVAQAHGGVVPVTVVAVIFTGILGSIAAPLFIRIFKVSDSVAAGLAIGACSHAVGTSKAIEIGEVEGAMSGLAIGICGVVTVLFSMFI
ncbi:LrgB family protein [Eubacterium sp. am_0171]|uniref:Inner membrane protein yohK n=1 Tax=Faecalicatena contorta TaxID=39482 RepID=A0A174KCD0_9FIRM|nr:MULTISPECIES: LrgB family protein [Clostridia]MBS6766056.1 LrgB family protein [Clostridium sp.]MDU7707423.1 LrgB family protein [Clostridium sp.]MSC85859.1 LrgB family protein [Eubacterium sp. BIOML-A1]MSD08198.1 LrgB family protein [Eubacterium sp. BIOML-A2]RYT12839.1 LrgB family protein [Eubacterium sp. am_0171]